MWTSAIRPGSIGVCERLVLVPVAVQLLVSTLKSIQYSVRIVLASVIAGREKNFIRKPGRKRRRKYFSVVLTLKDAAALEPLDVG